MNVKQTIQALENIIDVYGKYIGTDLSDALRRAIELLEED